MFYVNSDDEAPPLDFKDDDAMPWDGKIEIADTKKNRGILIITIFIQSHHYLSQHIGATKIGEGRQLSMTPGAVRDRERKAKERRAKQLVVDEVWGTSPYYFNHLKSKFHGLTRKRLTEFVVTANGTCGICLLPMDLKDHVPKHNGSVMDHDHALEALGAPCMRGLIHFDCNTGLGAFEKKNVFAAAVEYLNREPFIVGSIIKLRKGFHQRSGNIVSANDREKSSTLWGKYRVRWIEWLALLARSKNKCEICRSDDQLCLDHCHQSLAVRGVLCDSCSMGTGKLGHNQASIIRGNEWCVSFNNKFL